MGSINFDEKNLKVVDINLIRPNTWNPKSKDQEIESFKEIVKSIEINGLRQPIYVRENNGYEIVDGEQRWTACKALGFKEIVIYNYGPINDKEAIQITTGFQTQRPFEELGLAKLINDSIFKFPDIEFPYLDEKLDSLKELGKFEMPEYDTDEGDFEEGVKTLVVKMAEDKYDFIMKTLNQLMDEEGCDLARAIEMVCADYFKENIEV
jgi:ParB family chromosome partitioning protein